MVVPVGGGGCIAGITTYLAERTANTAELILSGSNCKRNHFDRTQFLSQSVHAGKVLIRIAAATQLWQLTLENCKWSNLAMNSGAGAGGTKIDHAIEDGATMYHQIELLGDYTAFGCSQFVDVATYTFTHGAAVGGAVAPILTATTFPIWPLGHVAPVPPSTRKAT